MKKNDQLVLNHSPYINYRRTVKKSLSGEIPIANLIDDLTSYANCISNYLYFELVVNECRKHKIRTVTFDHSSCCRNYFSESEKWSLLISDNNRVDSYKYIICLNPFLDKVDIAHKLTNMLGIRVLPEEVYYPIFFHEIGHIVYKHKDIEFLYFFNRCSQNEFTETYSEQEATAWKYAKNRFIEWKKRSSNIPRLQLPLFVIRTKFKSTEKKTKNNSQSVKCDSAV